MDYRNFLENELSSRTGRNSRYSLRSFARDLDISPGRLSLILSGKSGLSLPIAKKISQKLGFDENQCRAFCDGVAVRHARSPMERTLAKKRLKANAQPKLEKLSEEQFRVLAEWFHLAILELVAFVDFQADSRWIAKKLGITEIQAKNAWQRLVDLGLVKKSGKRWRAGDQSIIQKGNSLAIRSYHHQMLEKAKSAIDNQDVQERDLSSIIFLFSPDRLEEVQKDIREFRRHLMQKYQDQHSSEIYALQTQFYRITERKK